MTPPTINGCRIKRWKLCAESRGNARKARLELMQALVASIEVPEPTFGPYGGPHPATPQVIDEAVRWLRDIGYYGGATNERDIWLRMWRLQARMKDTS